MGGAMKKGYVTLTLVAMSFAQQAMAASGNLSGPTALSGTATDDARSAQSWPSPLGVDDERAGMALPNQAQPLLLARSEAANSASSRVKFISQVVPVNMTAGEKYQIVVQYKNLSRTPWRRQGAYRLTPAPAMAKSWRLKERRIRMEENTGPGEVATFRFEITAPARGGSYEVQWQMHHEGSGLLGARSPLLKVNIKEHAKIDAEFIHQHLPELKKSGEYYTILKRGSVYPVTLSFKNKGRVAWTGARIKLKTRQAGTLWMVEQIDLKARERIMPGEIKSFKFNIITPLEPGIYPFQWQLYDSETGWIGQMSEPVTITVQ